MHTRLKLTICAVLGGAGSLCSQLAAAADAVPQSDNNAGGLETIVVTAEKRSEQLIDVPMSVTALKGSDLQNLQDRDFADYAALVPGLSLNSAQPGFTRLTLLLTRSIRRRSPSIRSLASAWRPVACPTVSIL